MFGKFIRLALIVAYLGLTTWAVRAQDWPQWRGTNRDGVVKDFVAPAAWPEKLKQVWKTPVGSGYSSPIISKDRAWVHSRDNNEEAVTCLDLKTGKTLWRKTEAVAFSKNQYAKEMSNGPFATPALAGGRLYTLSVNAVLSCFDAMTGELKWRKDFGKPDTSKMFCGTAASPLIDGGNVIVYVGDDIKGGQMVALDAASGNERWKWTGEGPGYASPIIATFAGARQVVTMTDKSVVGIAAKDGALLWRLAWPDEWNENIVTPIVHKNSLILSGVRKGTVAVQIAKTGDKWEPKEVWRNAELTMYMNSPVLDGDHLFGMTNKRKGQLFCAEAATGKVLWTTEGREGANAAILQAKDLLFILNNDGGLIVARKSPKGFEQVAKYSVADSATYAHPIVFGNRILIKGDAAIALWSLE
ncbi:MAG: PQQ-like beta-propeller repeat protein [Acidobacteriota bacterium]|nr:PQQ-like beta-propeller repeat protein [Acidobacteriota bacterium]